MRNRASQIVSVTILAVVVATMSGAGKTLARTLEGRVESVEHGSEPQFPNELLTDKNTDQLPQELAGTWYGKVAVEQLEYYPKLHAHEPYCDQFIKEVSKLFHLNQPGELVFAVQRLKNKKVVLKSSDVILKGRMKLQMTAGKGPAAVPGGVNVPTTVSDRIRLMAHGAEQTRIDKVSILDQAGSEIHQGFTEISAQYIFESPKRLAIKMLEIDYDSQHKPLWKILIRGTATR